MIDGNNIIEAAEQAFANINTPYSSCMKVGFHVVLIGSSTPFGTGQMSDQKKENKSYT